MRVEFWREADCVKIAALVGPWSFEILLLWTGLRVWWAAYSLFPACVHAWTDHPPTQTPRILAVDLTLPPFTVSIRGEREPAQERHRYGLALTDSGVDFTVADEIIVTARNTSGEGGTLKLDGLPVVPTDLRVETSTEGTATITMSGEACET